MSEIEVKKGSEKLSGTVVSWPRILAGSFTFHAESTTEASGTWLEPVGS